MPDAAALSRQLTSAGLDCYSIGDEGWLGTVLRIDAGDALRAIRALAEADYVMLADLLGADTGDGLELTWHLRSFAADEELFVKAAVAYDAEVPSVWTVYAAALYPEREAAELFGLTFRGHPNPKRLLTSDESGPFLLRKSTPIRTRAQVARPGVRDGEE
ncbi:MAG: NADH-quinone oxidoreductase subunit C [Coriobacteriia bacterium]|nr:NADH-quinone oxidoreductase subunit C [Coriobacteriia bacterium]